MQTMNESLLCSTTSAGSSPWTRRWAPRRMPDELTQMIQRARRVTVGHDADGRKSQWQSSSIRGRTRRRPDHHRGDGGGQPRGRCGTARSQQIIATAVRTKAQGHQIPGLGAKVTREGHRGLHPPVRHHDRRGPAAGAVPGDPGLPAGQQGVQEDADRDPAIRGGRARPSRPP